MTRTACHLYPHLFLFPARFLILLSAMLAAALAFPPRLPAAEAGSSRTTRSLDFDCDRRFISQRQASWLLGTGNFSQTFAGRAALYAEVARACAAGVAVARIEGRQATAPSTRLAQR